MSYSVTELKNDNDNYLQFSDLLPGDIFILLTQDKISNEAALFKKDSDFVVFENATVLIANDINTIGKKRSVDNDRRVAKVKDLNVNMSLVLQREKGWGLLKENLRKSADT